MMRLVYRQCPDCKEVTASINIDDFRKKWKCKYCGHELTAGENQRWIWDTPLLDIKKEDIQ